MRVDVRLRESPRLIGLRLMSVGESEEPEIEAHRKKKREPAVNQYLSRSPEDWLRLRRAPGVRRESGPPAALRLTTRPSRRGGKRPTYRLAYADARPAPVLPYQQRPNSRWWLAIVSPLTPCLG